MVRYALTREALGFKGQIEIQQDEFGDIETAMTTCNVALDLEEKLHILIENYLDFEKHLLGLSIERAVRPHVTWPKGKNDMTNSARHLNNVLSAAKLLIDHTPQDLARALGKESSALEETKRARSRIFDTSLAYRCMEKLRNSMQHKSLSVHGFVYPDALDQDSPSRARVFGAFPQLFPALLRQDEKLKRLVQELGDLGDSIPLAPMVREYVEGLATVQEDVVRRSLAEAVQAADALVEATEDRGKKHFGDASSLCAVEIEGKRWRRKATVFGEPIGRRRALEQLNCLFKGLGRRCVRSDAT